MLTEAMKRSGWRPAPNEKVRDDWKARNGAWMVKTPSGPILADVAALMWKFEVLLEWPWRPVSAQTWDYDPRGWGVVVPTEPGLWTWADGEEFHIFKIGFPSVGPQELFAWGPLDDLDDDMSCWVDAFIRVNGGHWIAPCVKPEVLP